MSGEWPNETLARLFAPYPEGEECCHVGQVLLKKCTICGEPYTPRGPIAGPLHPDGKPVAKIATKARKIATKARRKRRVRK